jgi:YD repeat-containing protein
MDTTTYTYDAAGDLISVTDPADKVTNFAYDSYGDLISMIDPNGGATTFAYFAVPEPSTWAAMLLGFAGLAFAGRKKTSWVKAGVLATASRQSSSPASAALSLSAASSALRQCGAIAKARS